MAWKRVRPAVKRGQILLFANTSINGDLIVGASVAQRTAKPRMTKMFYWSVPLNGPYHRFMKGATWDSMYHRFIKKGS